MVDPGIRNVCCELHVCMFLCEIVFALLFFFLKCFVSSCSRGLIDIHSYYHYNNNYRENVILVKRHFIKRLDQF